LSSASLVGQPLVGIWNSHGMCQQSASYSRS
jgi:hypothetical protein